MLRLAVPFFSFGGAPMTTHASSLRIRLTVLAVLFSLSGLALLQGQEKLPAGKEPAQDAPRSPQPWTLEEARGQLQVFPNDAYLQYVALQLARRQQQTDN